MTQLARRMPLTVCGIIVVYHMLEWLTFNLREKKRVEPCHVICFVYSL